MLICLFASYRLHFIANLKTKILVSVNLLLKIFISILISSILGTNPVCSGSPLIDSFSSFNSAVFLRSWRSVTSNWTSNRTACGLLLSRHCRQVRWTMSSNSACWLTWLPGDSSATKRRCSGTSLSCWNGLDFDAGCLRVFPPKLPTYCALSDGSELKSTNSFTSIRGSSNKTQLGHIWVWLRREGLGLCLQWSP